MLFAAWIACSSSTVSLPKEARSPTVETLAGVGTEGLAGVGPAAVFASDTEWYWVDSAGVDIIAYGATGLPVAAARSQGERFVLTDQMHVLLDNGAVGIGPDALRGRALLDVCGDAAQLWLHTDAGVVVWRGDVLADLLVDGTAALGPVACDGRYLDDAVSWVADGDLIHAVAASTNQFLPLATESLPAPIDAVAIDVTGRPAVAAGGTLYRRRDGEWQRVRLGAEVYTVLGGRSATGVWAITARGPRFVPAGERPTVVELADGPGVDTAVVGRWRSDEVGRLLVRDESGLHRLSVNRPLWLDGVRSGDEVAALTRVQVQPTLPDQVTSLSARIEEADLDLPIEDGALVVDPDRLSAGQYTLLVQVDYDDGTTTTVRRRFWTAGRAGVVSWSGDVAPIHQETCALCHVDAAETILDGPGAWESQLADILSQVRSGAMPLGRPDLTPEEISVIEAWADGGFVR